MRFALLLLLLSVNAFASGGALLSGGGGVTSLNSLTGTLNLVQGTNITITPSGSNITIAAAGSSYTFQDSLVNTSGTVTLVGDTATPGVSQYYGTNGSSVLGYYNLPAGTPGGLDTAVQINESSAFGGNAAYIGTSTDYHRLLLNGASDDSSSALQIASTNVKALNIANDFSANGAANKIVMTLSGSASDNIGFQSQVSGAAAAGAFYTPILSYSNASTNGNALNGQYGAFGMYSQVTNASGLSAAFYGAAWSGPYNVGVIAQGGVKNTTNNNNFGILASAPTAGGTGNAIAGYFTADSFYDNWTSTSYPTFSAIIAGDNKSSGYDLANFLSSGTSVLRIDPSGNILSSVDGGINIGASGANRPNNIYTKGLNDSGLTASEPVVTDGSKNLASGSVSSPLTFSAGAFGCQTASGSQAGCLSSTDWTTFNSKLTSPMTTLGDIIYENATPAAARLAGGTGVLQEAAAGAPAWTQSPALTTPTVTTIGGYSGITSNLNTVASAAFTQSAIQLSMATVPLNLGSSAGGTYSFNSLGSGAIGSVTVSGGAVTAFSPGISGGTGYKVGDIVSVSSNGGNHDSYLVVTSVSGTAMTATQVLYGGTGYTSSGTGAVVDAQNTIPFTFTISGTLTSDAVFLSTSGSFITQSNQWVVNNNTTGSYAITWKISTSSNTATGTGVVIPQGTNNSLPAWIQTDGSTDIWWASYPQDTYWTSSGSTLFPTSAYQSKRMLLGGITDNGVDQLQIAGSLLDSTGNSTSVQLNSIPFNIPGGQSNYVPLFSSSTDLGYSYLGFQGGFFLVNATTVPSPTSGPTAYMALADDDSGSPSHISVIARQDFAGGDIDSLYFTSTSGTYYFDSSFASGDSEGILQFGQAAMNATQSSVTTDSGSMTCSQPFIGGSYQKALCYLSAAVSVGGTTWGYNNNFAQTPYLYGTATAVAHATADASGITFTSATPITGWLITEGY